MMNSTLPTFCLYTYVIVDDTLKRLTKTGRAHATGPAPECSDSELCTLLLIGESKGWDVEMELLSNMQAYRDMFPHLPTQSRLILDFELTSANVCDLQAGRELLSGHRNLDVVGDKAYISQAHACELAA
ncbi:MAG: transposase, partial [Chloroflexi bacterium]|nr:transposase [Chloroflexota bacterium]